MPQFLLPRPLESPGPVLNAPKDSLVVSPEPLLPSSLRPCAYSAPMLLTPLSFNFYFQVPLCLIWPADLPYSYVRP